MKKIVALLISFFLGLGGFAQSGGAYSKASKAVDELRGGNDKVLTQENFASSPAESALLLLGATEGLPSNINRTRVMSFAMNLYRDAKKNACGLPDPITEKKVVSSLFTILANDPSDSAREYAARELLWRFPRDLLGGHESELRKAALETQERPIVAVFQLFSVSPDSNPKDVTQYLKGLDAPDVREKMLDATEGRGLDAALAHQGDAAAEARLIMEMKSKKTSNVAEMDSIVESLALACSKQIVIETAKGLRSTEIINLAGGGWIPKRDYYAEALVMMMHERPDFPLKSARFVGGFTETDFDQLERWCQKVLGVQYPSEARAKVERSIMPNL